MFPIFSLLAVAALVVLGWNLVTRFGSDRLQKLMDPDMAASMNLQWVREIEYDTKLATGAAMAGGKVLRLRSQSQTFEFVLPDESIARWHTMLPRRGGEAREVRAV